MLLPILYQTGSNNRLFYVKATFYVLFFILRDPILVEWSTGKEEVRPGTKYWARTGLSGLAQPDNYNYRTNPEEGLDEACAAVHRDATGQPKLHDELCAQKYPVVCETSYAMPGDMMGGMLS